jgi:hypothetical protein
MPSQRTGGRLELVDIRLMIIHGVATRLVVVGTVCASSIFGCSAIAAADPAAATPTDPAMPVPPSAPVPTGVDAPLAQNGSAAGPLGGIGDLVGNGTVDLLGLLGQTTRPAVPGEDPGTPPEAYPLNNGYLLPQNVVPSAPGQGTVVGVAPGQENTDTSAIDYLQRLYASYQRGGLSGAMLGQRSLDQLGEPLPGTAPPPGTPMPAGLGQDLPDQPPDLAPPPPRAGGAQWRSGVIS